MQIIINLIETNRFKEARAEIIKLNVVDIAELLDELEPHSLVKVFRLLPKELSADVFAYLSPPMQQHVVQSITDREVSFIIDELMVDDAVDFLEEMPATIVKRVLANTDENTRSVINEFLRYEQDSAGSIMTIEYVDLKKDMTVAAAFERIRKTGFDKETVDTCYVTTSSRVLEGTITLRKLVLADPNELVSELMEENNLSVTTKDDQEQIAMMFRRYGLLSMPVVDNESRLVGIITVDDVVEVIEQENTEDFQKMAAMTPSYENYMDTKVLVLAKNRIIWLLVLMLSATFTGEIIRIFNISSVILSAYIPMLMDTAGNAGSQSATLIIRGMALGEISLGDIFRVQWKELRVSVITGLALALANFTRIMALERITVNGTAMTLMEKVPLAITVCASLFTTIVLAKFVGCSLPVLARRLGLDPAIMASPLVTTIVDALALIVFFSLAETLVPGLAI